MIRGDKEQCLMLIMCFWANGRLLRSLLHLKVWLQHFTFWYSRARMLYSYIETYLLVILVIHFFVARCRRHQRRFWCRRTRRWSERRGRISCARLNRRSRRPIRPLSPLRRAPRRAARSGRRRLRARTRANSPTAPPPAYSPAPRPHSVLASSRSPVLSVWLGDHSAR